MNIRIKYKERGESMTDLYVIMEYYNQGERCGCKTGVSFQKAPDEAS